MKLDDLPSSSLAAPVGSPTQDPLAISASEIFRFIQHLKMLELDPDLAFAYDTIAGIRCLVEVERRITERQRTAIQNIEVGAERARAGREDRGRRRYRWDR